jgi:EAL domain-containing protein (putative c-di-GMP-specific phosphodiesterase class I)
MFAGHRGTFFVSVLFPPPDHRSGCPELEALRAGLAQGEIHVRYQPVVRVQDRRPVMVEALARWEPPSGGVAPELFVPLAALAELAPLWSRLRLGVTINLPLALVLEPGLPRWLDRAFGWSVLAPRQVAIELTETTPVRDPATLQRALLRLRAAGYRVLLDDVTLQDDRDRLLALPFSGLKLDRSLVERLPQDGRARRAVRRLVTEAEARGQTVIAEGVSHPAHWAALRGLGVHFAQGFAVGLPLPAAALPRWAATWRSAATASA